MLEHMGSWDKLIIGRREHAHNWSYNVNGHTHRAGQTVCRVK